ncbi:hypothetical protein T03_17195, partial [Trichinella britovi]
LSISCSSPSSPESHIHEILIPGIHQRTSRFRSDVEIESLQFTPNI